MMPIYNTPTRCVRVQTYTPLATVIITTQILYVIKVKTKKEDSASKFIINKSRRHKNAFFQTGGSYIEIKPCNIGNTSHSTALYLQLEQRNRTQIILYSYSNSNFLANSSILEYRWILKNCIGIYCPCKDYLKVYFIICHLPAYIYRYFRKCIII